jgi:glycosidase
LKIVKIILEVIEITLFGQIQFLIIGYSIKQFKSKINYLFSFIKRSVDGSVAWSNANGVFYYHKYDSSKPDLNYRNPVVVEELIVN